MGLRPSKRGKNRTTPNSLYLSLELSIEILLLVFGLGNGVVDGSGDFGLDYSAKLSDTKNRLVRPFAGGPR